MRPMHETFLATIAAERGRLASRRSLLTGSGKLAVGGAAALALGGTGLARVVRPAAAQEFTDDLDVANYALTLEHLEFAFYRDGLDLFGEAAFEEANLRPDLRGRLEEIRDHEGAHVDFLTKTIVDAGGEPVAEAEYDFGYGEDLGAFLETAMVLENVGVSAYAGAAPSIADPAILAAALGVHSVEARHAAYLNDANEASPFPEAVDVARTREEVLELASPFFVDDGGTPGAGADATTVAVEIDEYEFRPAELTIAAGTTVTWTNVGFVAHTATGEDDTFDTGVLLNGESASHTFADPGTYPYVCALHAGSMKATVDVT